jgi:hypothetical protein
LFSGRIDMEERRVITRRRALLLILVFAGLLIFGVLFTQPYVAHRLSTKIFTAYQIYLLKYPNSKLIETETRATSKVTMRTGYTFHSLDNVDTVLRYMEQQQPGFIQMVGSRVITEPTFRNTTCADETIFNGIFQLLERGVPCIEINIYPAATIGTSIQISENWYSISFPAWLINW